MCLYAHLLCYWGEVTATHISLDISSWTSSPCKLQKSVNTVSSVIAQQIAIMKSYYNHHQVYKLESITCLQLSKFNFVLITLISHQPNKAYNNHFDCYKHTRNTLHLIKWDAVADCHNGRKKLVFLAMLPCCMSAWSPNCICWLTL